MTTRERGAADLLTRDEIRAFTQPADLGGVVAIAWSWLVIACVFAALAWWPHPAMFALAVVILGGRQLALAVMMHEAAHGTLFRTRWCNEVLTDWLCARPVWSDVARYRKHHLGHHAHTGTDRDPDLGLAPVSPMTRGSLARKIARDLLGAAGVRRLVALALMDAQVLTYNVGGGTRWNKRGAWFHLRAFVVTTWKMFATNAVMFAVCALAGVGWIYLAWVVAWLTTFGLFLRVRMLAEHACLERGPDPLRNTRTTYANLVARATVAPLHVNYHLEHHLLPTTPWFRLPALHRTLASRGVIPETSTARGYTHVLRTVSAARTGR
ncbi:MAG: fatty acid desaturase family protein [Kofleriaceae bacterium]